jgi:hypothetical protein
MARVALLLMVLGATLGVALDAWHVASHTTSYPHPWVFGVAIWTFPLFASAGVMLGLIPLMMERALRRPVQPASLTRSLVALALFVAAYFVSGLLQGAACAVALVAFVAAIYRVGAHPSAGLVIFHTVGAACVGTSVEMTLVHLRAFSHTDVRFFGVAPWLPLLYACASLALSSLARTLAVKPVSALAV